MLQALIDQSGEAIPFSVGTLAMIQIAQALLLATIINSFFTFGEEFGWRAYLQPKLLPMGFRKTMLWMGPIWGL
jgi:membrane protease YdiL (CAAX protease family)